MGSVIALASRRADTDIGETLDEIDVHIGQRIRRRRRLLGLSQGALGEACGVSFQQIQKFECASVRLTAVRLWLVAEALQAPISYFYDGLTSAQREHMKSQDQAPEVTTMASEETQDLIRTYARLGEIPRRRLLDLARAMNDLSDS
jgi:transcriptional regulator with XRE-family HTH domain